jgi:glutamyl-tRNA synthetase/glutamyl-Q tRNA(Asp) synthetase
VLFDGLDIAALAARLPADPLTRFAPAPTGWLHLGHVLNAEYVWGLARALGGRVLLRIEDHDRGRSRPEFEAGLLDDLDWLGFQPDVFSTSQFRAGRCEGRQSDRDEIYAAAAEVLERQGLVYACDCSRREISIGGSPHGEELRYTGRCRERRLDVQPGVGSRLRTDRGMETFDDVRLGLQHQDPASQCGDVLLRDRTGNWTYQFAAAVDDWRQGVHLVIRGIDLLPSTGRQIRIARLLGRERMPVFLHHALIMKSPAQKLSKSDGDAGVRELRARGWTPAAVRHAAITTVSGGHSSERHSR